MFELLKNQDIPFNADVSLNLFAAQYGFMECEGMHMIDYTKITALFSRLSVGDEDRDGGESNSIQNQKKFLESYARQLKRAAG